MIATITSVATVSASVTNGAFDVNRITKRTVSGDFNGDGIDDVAGIYYYGNGETRIFTWLSNGKDFSLNWNYWYTKSGFNADKMTGRVVAGDFNGDGKDDICAFYDYGKGECRSFVWESADNSFNLKWDKWYMKKGFSADRITNRVVAGDFNSDGKDDICAFYDYGKGECRAFVYNNMNGKFSLSWNYWYMKSGFSASNITNRVVAGDFNNDNRTDICAFYDYGKGLARAFVWHSWGSNMTLNWNYWYSDTTPKPKSFEELRKLTVADLRPYIVYNPKKLTKDDVAYITKKANEYIASLPNCTLDTSLTPENAGWNVPEVLETCDTVEHDFEYVIACINSDYDDLHYSIMYLYTKRCADGYYRFYILYR